MLPAFVHNQRKFGIVIWKFNLRFRIPSNEVVNVMAQLLVFRERIWTVGDVGRYIGVFLRKLCNPKCTERKSDGQDDEFDLLI